MDQRIFRYIQNISKIKMYSVHLIEIQTEPLEPINLKKIRACFPNPSSVKLRFIDPRREREKEIISHGISNVINPHYEYFTGRPQTRREDFIQALQKFLDVVLKGKNLFIIDPYIFPKKYDSDYISFFLDILKKYLKSLTRLKIITSASHNESLKIQIINEILRLNKNLKIEIKISNDFHDRFWISPRSRRGIFMGTSLNGLGKKYTLIDYISQEDTRILLNEIKNLR